MNESVVRPQQCETDAQGYCATCADEAIVVTVLKVDKASLLAVVKLNDTALEIDTSLIDNVQIGDQLLIHAGVALAKTFRPQK